MRRINRPLVTPGGRAPRVRSRRIIRTNPLPFFYEHEITTQTLYGESLARSDYVGPLELEFPSVVYNPQIENPIGPTVMGLRPGDYGVATGEVVPVLGQPAVQHGLPMGEIEPAVQQGLPMGEIQPAVQQGLPVGEIQPAVQQGLPAQASIVEAAPVSCGGGVPSPNNTASQLPFTIDPGPPGGGPGGSGNGSGGGFGGFGNPGGPSGSGNIVPFLGHILFWLFLWQLLLWLADYSLKKFKKFCEDYVDIREKLRQSEETEKKPVKRPFPLRPPWIDIWMDIVVGIIIALFAPELAQRLIQNISNRWTQAILKILLPVTKLAGAIGLLLSLSLTYMTVVRWLVHLINPYLDKIVWNALRTSTSADGRIMFASLWLKCLLAALLAGVVFRVITQYNKKYNVENIGLIFVCGWALIFIYNNQYFFQQAAKRLLNISVCEFLLNSQLGRWSLVVGSTRILLVFDEWPLALFFYSFFLYSFRVLALATTATPNLI